MPWTTQFELLVIRMSDIAIFSENDMFLPMLMGFAPLGIMPLVIYFLGSLGKHEAAKILFYGTTGYGVFFVSPFIFLILTKR